MWHLVNVRWLYLHRFFWMCDSQALVNGKCRLTYLLLESRMIWHLASRAVYAAVTHKWEEVIPRLYAVLSINVKTSHFLWLPLMKAAAPLRRFTFSSTPIGILLMKYLKIKFSPPTVNGTADNKKCRFFSIVSRTFRHCRSDIIPRRSLTKQFGITQLTGKKNHLRLRISKPSRE